WVAAAAACPTATAIWLSPPTTSPIAYSPGVRVCWWRSTRISPPSVRRRSRPSVGTEVVKPRNEYTVSGSSVSPSPRWRQRSPSNSSSPAPSQRTPAARAAAPSSPPSPPSYGNALTRREKARRKPACEPMSRLWPYTPMWAELASKASQIGHRRSAPQANALAPQGPGRRSRRPVAIITMRACQRRPPASTSKPSSAAAMRSTRNGSNGTCTEPACRRRRCSSSRPPTPPGKPGQLLLSGIQRARLSPVSKTTQERWKRRRYSAAVSPAGPPPTMATSIMPMPRLPDRRHLGPGRRQRGEKRGASAPPARGEVAVGSRPAPVAGADVVADAPMQVVRRKPEPLGDARPAAARILAPGLDQAAAGAPGGPRQGAGVIHVARAHAVPERIDDQRARRLEVARDLVDERVAVARRVAVHVVQAQVDPVVAGPRPRRLLRR